MEGSTDNYLSRCCRSIELFGVSPPKTSVLFRNQYQDCNTLHEAANPARELKRCHQCRFYVTIFPVVASYYIGEIVD